MFDKEEYKKVINVPLAVIIASFIIIIITTGMTNKNGVSALIGGYTGLLLGVLFIIVLNIPTNNWINFFPFFYVMFIVSILLYYLYAYFGKISNGEISSYYGSFSILSTIFLATQLIILFSSMFSSNGDFSNNFLSNKTFSILSLLAVINFLMVITLGIILHFYSTQG
jgi:F0F1-type ATP synthase assembly protein I